MVQSRLNDRTGFVQVGGYLRDGLALQPGVHSIALLWWKSPDARPNPPGRFFVFHHRGRTRRVADRPTSELFNEWVGDRQLASPPEKSVSKVVRLPSDYGVEVRGQTQLSAFGLVPDGYRDMVYRLLTCTAAAHDSRDDRCRLVDAFDGEVDLISGHADASTEQSSQTPVKRHPPSRHWNLTANESAVWLETSRTQRTAFPRAPRVVAPLKPVP